MKLFKPGVALALVGAGLAATPTGAAQAAPQGPDDTQSMVQQMRNQAEGTISVKKSTATDRVNFVRSTGDLAPSVENGKSKSDAAAKAEAYVDDYAGIFGAKAAQLEKAVVTKTPAGFTVDFAQSHRGVPVFGAKLRAHVDKQGDLTSVTGFVAPDLDVDVSPRLDEDAATAKAISLAANAPAGAGEAAADKPRQGDLKVTSADLMIYRMGAIQGIEGDNLLTWVVEVTDGKQVRETSILDANTGKPVNRYSMMAHALDRDLHEESIDTDPVWSEGDAFPGELDDDQQNEVEGTGESYWFFMNSFGRDSFNGEGAKMITVNNDPNIQCPNANWNGISTNYCSGVSSDDTVAHEWGHAYTEYTSGLLYQWQSGAMNEAYSDIWGETVDMLNGRLDTVDARDETGPVTLDETTKRSDSGQCSLASPADLSFTITSPESIAGPCAVVKPAWSADYGDAFDPDNTGITADLVVARDTTAGDGTETDGCDTTWTNAAEISGNFAFVDRGVCTFQEKIDNAVANGATGLVIGNNAPGFFNPGGAAPEGFYGATISQADGDKIKSVDDVVSVNITESAANRDKTARWLSGEDDPAFGGAIRDMWNPNCYGDPGKVSDEEYHCGTDDNGGVHTNSGVVNHTYALLVDGGTSNDVAVTGIGLDKAAHIFWHTQTNYLTPISGFVDLANGLDQSCRDLTGLESLNKLAIGTSDTGGAAVDPTPMDPITAADCEAVAAAAQATELRKEPVQCNFRLMFKRGQVSCGDDTKNETLWSEDFEDGLPSDWEQDIEYFEMEGVGSGQAHFDASVVDVSDLPITKGGAEHRGAPNALYFNDKGEAGNFGSCNFDENDYSSRVGLATPELTVPKGHLPRLSFDHLSASEVGWDGGNVKVSVNGGDFEIVPSAAWLYNAPGSALNSLAEGNTNPMAGQESFTGTDGGVPTGSWGTSVIDLTEFADAGDTVAFRFDFGMDGCNGVDGWYIDNVEMSVCTDLVAAVPSETKAKAKPKKLANKNKTAKVTVKVTADGVTPTGKVKITVKGKKKVLAKGKLKDGKVTLKVKGKKLKKGKNKLVATYLGSDSVKASKDTFTIKRKR